MPLSKESDGRGWRLTSVPVWGVAAVQAKSTGFVSSRPGLTSGVQPSPSGDSGLSLFMSAIMLLAPFSKGGLECSRGEWM